jgi:NADH dehydrogenase [ubiquinone] 1 alpha subcomplex assembly factor 7
MQRLDEFMADALGQYYDTRDPLGMDGDFTTAPEISQLFGEIIGIWAVQKWVEIGSPPSFNLIEIGPGRGTCMSDILRGTHHITPFHDAMDIHLVETSTTLKKRQRDTLKNYDVQWHEHLLDIPNELPSIIIANEFFDALPIQQFKYSDDAWREHYIDNGKTIWVAVNDAPIKSTLPTPQNGDICEYSQIQENYARLLSTYHGASLFIDYGYEKSAFGDSLQALYKHAPCAITDNVGDADLTTHIDFEWLATFFKNTNIKTQSQFLMENGISIRYQHLNNPDLTSGYERLTNANQMGHLFKVLETIIPIS